MNGFISFPSSKALNPFIQLLNSHLTEQGWQEHFVERFWWKPLDAYRLRNTISILHFHWPESIWRSSSYPVSIIKAAAFIAYFYYVKMLGYKTVFSFHNAIPHFGKTHDQLERFMRKWMLKSMDLIVGHSDNVYEEIYSYYKIHVPRYVLVRHGLYENYTDGDFSEETLLKPMQAITKPKLYLSYSSNHYKGSQWFLTHYVKYQYDNHCLILSGNVPEEWLRKLEQSGNSFFYHRENYKGIKGFLSDKSMVTLIKASDIVALPYHHITTSGAYFLTRTFDKPVIAPRLPFFIAMVNDQQSFLYEPESFDGIHTVLQSLTSQKKSTQRSLHQQIDLSWEKSSKALAEAYFGLLEAK